MGMMDFLPNDPFAGFNNAGGAKPVTNFDVYSTAGEMNRAARVARFGEDMVQRMEAAGAKTDGYFRGPSMNAAPVAPAVGVTPPPVVPPGTPGAAVSPEQPGKVAKFVGGAKSLFASPWMRGAGAAVGIPSAVVAGEDMMKNGVSVDNAMSLGLGALGTAAAIAPAAVAAPVLAGATALGAGYGAGRTLMPDPVATALASLMGRMGMGKQFAGGAPEIAPGIAGPETAKFVQSGAGNFKATPELMDSLKTAFPQIMAAPVAPRPPVPAPAATQTIVPDADEGGVRFASTPAEKAAAAAAARPVASTVPILSAEQMLAENSTGGARRGGAISVDGGPARYVGSPVAYGAKPSAAAYASAKPINPRTGMPYSGDMVPKTGGFLGDTIKFIASRGAEGAANRAYTAERTVRAAQIREDAASRRALIDNLTKPVTQTDASGNQTTIYPGSQTSYSTDPKTGQVVTKKITAAAPPFNEASVKAQAQKLYQQNPTANASQIRATMKQIYPDKYSEIQPDWLKK